MTTTIMEDAMIALYVSCSVFSWLTTRREEMYLDLCAVPIELLAFLLPEKSPTTMLKLAKARFRKSAKRKLSAIDDTSVSSPCSYPVPSLGPLVSALPLSLAIGCTYDY